MTFKLTKLLRNFKRIVALYFSAFLYLQRLASAFGVFINLRVLINDIYFCFVGSLILTIV